jgi:hypothetical protein
VGPLPVALRDLLHGLGIRVRQRAHLLEEVLETSRTDELDDDGRLVRGRAARGEERERLWDRWRQIDKDLDAYAARRPTETAVVVLEPRDTATLG